MEITYQAKNVEEMKGLESSMKCFFDRGFNINGAGNLLVKTGFSLDDKFAVDIFPVAPLSKIEYVFSDTSRKGSVIGVVKVSPEFAMLEIGDARYRINYNPEKK